MGKKIGFTCSTFDLLHAGHVMMLRDAKQQCDYLICGIQVDPSTDRPEKNAPIQTIVERYTQLKAVGYVDEIIPYGNEEDLEDILTLYNIDVRILGENTETKTLQVRISVDKEISVYTSTKEIIDSVRLD